MANEKRLIYLEDAKEALTGWETDPTDGEIEYTLDNLPIVDAVEVVHGRWENIRFITTGDGRARIGDCSSCKSIERVRNYCPNCGAKMDGDGNG